MLGLWRSAITAALEKTPMPNHAIIGPPSPCDRMCQPSAAWLHIGCPALPMAFDLVPDNGVLTLDEHAFDGVRHHVLEFQPAPKRAAEVRPAPHQGSGAGAGRRGSAALAGSD